MKTSVSFYPSASEYFLKMPEGSKIPRGLEKKLQSIMVKKIDAEIRSNIFKEVETTNKFPNILYVHGIPFYSYNNTLSLKNLYTHEATLFKAVNRDVFACLNCFV